MHCVCIGSLVLTGNENINESPKGPFAFLICRFCSHHSQTSQFPSVFSKNPTLCSINKIEKAFSPIGCAINDRSWQCDAYQMSAWRLPDDCLTTSWLLHDNCLKTAWRLPVNCLTTASQLPDNYLMTAWHLLNEYLMTARWLPWLTTGWWLPLLLPVDCLTSAWLLLMTARQLHDELDICLTTIWWLPDICLKVIWYMPDDCLTTAIWLPENRMMTAWKLLYYCLMTTWHMTTRRLLHNCKVKFAQKNYKTYKTRKTRKLRSYVQPGKAVLSVRKQLT